MVILSRSKFKLDEAGRTRIQAAVREAEKNTSGEIVPVIASESDTYFDILFVSVLALWLVSAGLLSAINLRWHLPTWECFAIQGTTLFLGAMILTSRAILSRVISKRRAAMLVHRRALATFLQMGVSETRERSGVLIYLSLLERRIEIVADRGIYSKVPPSYWTEKTEKLARSFTHGDVIEPLCELINSIGRTLATEFPRAPDDKNELDDDVRVDP